jgi:hypothetical protein
VLRQHRRLDEIVGQQFNPATATRRSLRHWRRADRLRVLDLGGSDRHLQGNPWRRGSRFSPGRLLDDFTLGLGGSFRGLPGPLVSTPAWVPRQGCHLLQRLSTRNTHISAYDYSSWSSAASRRVLTFDYGRLWQRRFGSRRLSHGLGLRSGLLDGRHGLSCPCCRGLFPVPAQICGFSAQVSTKKLVRQSSTTATSTTHEDVILTSSTGR